MFEQSDHDGGPFMPATARVATRWTTGSFAENLLIDSQGRIYVALYTNNRIDRYDPASDEVHIFADLPAPTVSMAEGPDGQIWAVTGTFYTGPAGIWKIDPNGSPILWVALPEARFINGCTIHPDRRTLLVCDSHLGHVLAVDLQHPNRVKAWLSDARLIPLNKKLPGANGIKIFQNEVWISVTDQNLVYRAHLNSYGTPGRLEVVHNNLHVDDFAFSESGSLYYATHTKNTVGRIDLDGRRTTLAGPAQHVVGATACALGRSAATSHLLYITTDGGFFAPYPGIEQAALLVEINLGDAASRAP
jgi:sugar lactone lactonase YvrE